MRLLNALKVAFPLALAAGVVAVSCTGQLASVPGEGPGGDGEPVYPGCDPDGGAPCPDDYFICVEDGAGNKRCEGQVPAVPGDGEWECYEEGTTIVCRGDEMPAGDGGFWECEQIGDNVVCRAHAYVPSDGGDGIWECHYEGEFRVCESGEGGSWDGPADDDGEAGGGGGSSGDEGSNFWDDWFPDSGEEWVDEIEDLVEDIFTGGGSGGGGGGGGEGGDDGDEGCLCVPGAERFCDTPTYCRWGVQRCRPNGLEWGPCRETSIPEVCQDVDSWYSPEAEDCCVAAGFCCQDMWDRDRDGDTWESLGECTDIVCI